MRKTKLLVSILSLVLVLSIFAGCQFSGMDATQATEPSSEATEPSEPIDPDVLSLTPPSQEVLKELSDALVNVGLLNKLVNYPKDCGGDWIYGTINGCIVVFIDGQLHAEWEIYVADCEFVSGSSFLIEVYKDGEVCELKDAYEKGWLTEDHIKQLEARHPDIFEEMDKAKDEWWAAQQETQGS